MVKEPIRRSRNQRERAQKATRALLEPGEGKKSMSLAWGTRISCFESVLAKKRRIGGNRFEEDTKKKGVLEDLKDSTKLGKNIYHCWKC